MLTKTTLFLLIGTSICYGQTLCGNNDFVGESDPDGQKDASHATGTQVIAYDNQYEFQCCGLLDSWQLRTDGDGEVTLQIWRPTTSPQYQLIWQYRVFVTDRTLRSVSIPPSLSTTVQSGDVIGWYDTSGSVSYKNDNKYIAYVATVAAPANGSTLTVSNTQRDTYGIRADLRTNTSPKLVNLPTSATYAKGALSVNDVLLTISATEEDQGQTLTYTSSSSSAVLTRSGLNIQVGSTPTAGTHTITVTVTDDCGSTASGTYTLTITNTVPVITSLPTSVSVSEDNSADLTIHTLTTSDADGDTVTCTYTGTYSATFQITGSSVVLKGTATLDYDTRNHYVVTITCSDGTDSVTSNLDVYVLRNSVPDITNLQSTASITSTTAVNSNIYTVTSTDAESDAVTYSHYCIGTSCPFTMNSATGVLSLQQSLVSTTQGAYAVYVTACDARGCSDAEILTVYVTDLQTQPSIVNLPQTISVNENTGGVVLYTISTYDEDGDTSFTFSMTSSPSTTKLSIDSTCKCVSIPTGTFFNYESDSRTYTLTIQAADAYHTSTAKTLTVNVLDVNEVPVLTTPSYTITNSEAAAGTQLPKPAYAFTDPDAGDSHTYWLAGGVNSSIISVDSATGKLYYAIDYDYDTAALGKAPEILVEIRDSGGLSTTATVTLSVTDVNDNAPDCGESLYVTSLDKDSSVGTTVFEHSATDSDSGTNAVITYTIDHTNGVQGGSSAVLDVLSTGTVFLTSSVSALTVSEINATITATDGGTPAMSCTYKLMVRLVTKTKGFLDLNLAWFVPLLLLLALTSVVAIFFLCRHGCHGACTPSSSGKWTPPLKHTIDPKPQRNVNAPRPREDYMGEMTETRRSLPRKVTTPTEVRVMAQSPAWESWTTTNKF